MTNPASIDDNAISTMLCTQSEWVLSLKELKDSSYDANRDIKTLDAVLAINGIEVGVLEANDGIVRATLLTGNLSDEFSKRMVESGMSLHDACVSLIGDFSRKEFINDETKESTYLRLTCHSPIEYIKIPGSWSVTKQAKCIYKHISENGASILELHPASEMTPEQRSDLFSSVSVTPKPKPNKLFIGESLVFTSKELKAEPVSIVEMEKLCIPTALRSAYQSMNEDERDCFERVLGLCKRYELKKLKNNRRTKAKNLTLLEATLVFLETGVMTLDDMAQRYSELSGKEQNKRSFSMYIGAISRGNENLPKRFQGEESDIGKTPGGVFWIKSLSNSLQSMLDAVSERKKSIILKGSRQDLETM